MNNKKFKLNKEDYILYILNKLEPEKSDKIKLNKIAFFVEFAYFLKFKHDLSDTEYAAINMGPIIDGYELILKDMQKRRLVKVDGYIVRPLESPKIDISDDERIFIDGLINRYSKFRNNELIALSHATDTYKITTDNERQMGNKINKKLALLETFLADSDGEEDNLLFSEDELPKINRSQLIQYAG